MAKYRKKPVVIDAVQFLENLDEVKAFVGSGARFQDGRLLIDTLEGALHASPGDWVIKGIGGEFYPCKPDIFKASYEPTELTQKAEPSD